MPLRRNRKIPPRPPVMTWGKALPIIVLAGAFDALRAMSEQLWFFGPALVGLGVGVATGSSAAGTAAGVFSGVLGLATGAAAGIEYLGVILAMAIGLAGWGTVGFLIILFNPRMFAHGAPSGRAALRFLIALAVSEAPIIGTLPALTTAVGSGYHEQIKREKAALKKWQKENADLLRQEQRERAQEIRAAETQIFAAQNAELALEAAAANDNEIPEEGAEAA